MTLKPLPTPLPQWRQAVDEALEQSLNAALQPTVKRYPHLHSELKRLEAALKHGVLLGGKRLRPLLALAVWQGLTPGGFKAERPPQASLQLAAAIELMHAQSLVFDDLPCMDNDDWRRGKATVHKAFDEATALLVGNALVSLPFGLLAQLGQQSPASLAGINEVTVYLAEVAGLEGLVSGQYLDLQGEGQPLNEQSAQLLESIHLHKTAALLSFSLASPALFLQAPQPVIAQLKALGQELGLLFQLQDDLLDRASTQQTLGKTVGKDVAQQKLTYPALLGLEAAEALKVEKQAQVEALVKQLSTQLNTGVLTDLLQWLYQREH
jgi:geranylgeranyl pyrophosphate synthase